MNNQLAQLQEPRRWRQQAYPIAVVAAIIRRQAGNDPAYLFIQRIHPPYAGQWALVGGKWDFGESLVEAITREVWEETGVGATYVALRECVNERLFPQTSADLGAHFIIFVCELEIAAAEPTEQDEGQLAWFTESQMDELFTRQEIAPTYYWIMKQYLKAPEEVPYIEVEIIARGTEMLASNVRRFSAVR